MKIGGAQSTLQVDEAHSLGVLGARGLGVQEHFALPPAAIDIKMGTLSKALASTGGFVAANRELVDYLRHHARGYMFSGALPAASVGAALAALELLHGEPERVARLQANARTWKQMLDDAGFDTMHTCTPIVPVRLPDERPRWSPRSAVGTVACSRCRSKHPACAPASPPATPKPSWSSRAT